MEDLYPDYSSRFSLTLILYPSLFLTFVLFPDPCLSPSFLTLILVLIPALALVLVPSGVTEGTITVAQGSTSLGSRSDLRGFSSTNLRPSTPAAAAAARGAARRQI